MTNWYRVADWYQIEMPGQPIQVAASEAARELLRGGIVFLASQSEAGVVAKNIRDIRTAALSRDNFDPDTVRSLLDFERDELSPDTVRSLLMGA